MHYEAQELALAAGGIAIGASIIAALAALLKTALDTGLKKLVGLFVRSATLSHPDANMVMVFLVKTHRRLGDSEISYSTACMPVKSCDELRTIVMKQGHEASSLFWYKKAPLFYKTGEKDQDATRYAGSFWYFRWTIDFEKLLSDAAKHRDEIAGNIEHEGFEVVYRASITSDNVKKNDEAPPSSPKDVDIEPINWPRDDIGKRVPESPLKLLSLSGAAQSIVDDVRFWEKHRDWYKERDIPWTRRYMFYGRPGSGKTSLVRAIAQEFDMPLWVISMGGMTNAEFTRNWRDATYSPRRAVLIEDIDGVFSGRDAVQADPRHMTFDTLLNAIDGVEQVNGILLFITTNHIDQIDPALGVPDGTGQSTRPGRIDVVVELPGLDYEGRYKLIYRIVRDPDQSRTLALETESDSPAQIKDKAFLVARKQLWG